MENKVIAIGSDHGGFELKQEIIKYLTEKNIEFKDFGCYDETSCDYTEYGKAVAEAVVAIRTGPCDCSGSTKCSGAGF